MNCCKKIITVKFGLLSVIVFIGAVALYATAPIKKNTHTTQSLAATTEIGRDRNQDKPDVMVLSKDPDKITINKKKQGSPKITQSPQAIPHPMLSNLFLRGIVNGGLENAMAVIEKKGRQRLYKTGDAIEHGILIRILEKSVIIRIDETEEMLKIESGSIRDEGVKQTIISRHDWESSLADLNGLISKIEVNPHTGEDGRGGLRVSGIIPGSLPADLGFRDGDIIQEINGAKIQNPGLLSNLYQGLKYMPIDLMLHEDPIEKLANSLLSVNDRSTGVIYEISKAYRKVQSNKNIPISFLRDGKQETLKFSVDRH